MVPERCASSGCSCGRALGRQRAEHGSSGAFARATRLRRRRILGTTPQRSSRKFASDFGGWHYASGGKVDPLLEKRVGKEEAMSINPQDGSRPTVVLVHGAFADASSWNE